MILIFSVSVISKIRNPIIDTGIYWLFWCSMSVYSAKSVLLFFDFGINWLFWFSVSVYSAKSVILIIDSGIYWLFWCSMSVESDRTVINWMMRDYRCVWSLQGLCFRQIYKKRVSPESLRVFSAVENWKYVPTERRGRCGNRKSSSHKADEERGSVRHRQPVLSADTTFRPAALGNGRSHDEKVLLQSGILTPQRC